MIIERREFSGSQFEEVLDISYTKLTDAFKEICIAMSDYYRRHFNLAEAYQIMLNDLQTLFLDYKFYRKK